MAKKNPAGTIIRGNGFGADWPLRDQIAFPWVISQCVDIVRQIEDNFGMKTTTLNIRLDAETKQKAEALFENLGLSISTAVNMFLRQSIREQAFPFLPKNEEPNAVTIAAMQEIEDARAGKIELPSYKNVDEMFKDLGIS